jgi:rare lipoprotein A
VARFFQATETMGLERRLSAARLIGLLIGAAVAMAAVERPPGPARIQRVQHGLASYYGPGFHGEETASGEIFDQREMVAAHRTLPLGTVVRVTNLENGRRVVLRVIDRGPYGANFRKGTIIDVSKGAAARLRFLEEGLVEVKVEVLRLPDRAETRARGG